jgi:glycosyltransferase involved in cell wall biosynthesis
MSDVRRRLLWASLADERPNREYHWLSQMPGTRVTVAGGPPPSGGVDWIERGYRRPVRRFTEAVALAWIRDLQTIEPVYDWCASLELCSLVTAQVSGWAERTGTKQAVVIWANDPELMFYSLPPYKQAYHRARRADLFLNFVQAGYDHCLALGLPEERCAVVLPGVDTDLFRPPPEPPEQPVISFISPLVPKKGVRLVLDAFALVRRVVPEARLQVMGRGSDEALVRQAAESSGGAVRYLGVGDIHRVAQVLQETTVFTTAPRASHRWNEQYGLAYLEAMATGVPVVTTICGTNHEAVVPPNVRVPDDAEALAEGLLTMLDPAHRATVSAFNRAHVLANHDMLTQAAAMGRVFDRFEGRVD